MSRVPGKVQYGSVVLRPVELMDGSWSYRWREFRVEREGATGHGTAPFIWRVYGRRGGFSEYDARTLRECARWLNTTVGGM